MRKILVILSLIVGLQCTLFGEDVWFTWKPNPATELVSGYRLEYVRYISTNSPSTNWSFLTYVKSSTNVAIVKGVQSGYIYKFRIFAVNSIGTGTNLSNIITIPTNLPSAVIDYQLTTPK